MLRTVSPCLEDHLSQGAVVQVECKVCSTQCKVQDRVLQYCSLSPGFTSLSLSYICTITHPQLPINLFVYFALSLSYMEEAKPGAFQSVSWYSNDDSEISKYISYLVLYFTDSSCWFSLYIIPSETTKYVDFTHSNFLNPFWHHMKLMMYPLFGRCSWIVSLFFLVLFSFFRTIALWCLISVSSREYSISC